MDWLNPETWKPFAALAEYWRTIALAAVAIGGAIGAFIKWGWTPVSLAWSRLIKARQKERPLRFVLDDQLSFWSPAGTQQGTHVLGHWYVTNTSDRNVAILKVRLRKHQARHAMVFGAGGAPEPTAVVPAHSMREIRAQFSFLPPICHGRKALVADVIFTDNYGDEHCIRSVRFTYRGP